MKDGGPAFPVTTNTAVHPDSPEIMSGMTMRQWYAGRADIPWDAVMETLKIRDGHGRHTVSEVIEYRAMAAFLEADAKIAHEANEPQEDAP